MIKIKLALIDSDEIYVNRLTNYFNAHYSDKLEVFSFTKIDTLLNFIQSNRINVLLATEDFNFDQKLFNGSFAFAYLVDSNNIESVNGKKAICKFQKTEIIYKEILNLYSELSENSGVALKTDIDGETKIITFLPVAGGVGSSTMAAACSYNIAARGKRVLYLNLEQLGTPSLFFNGEGAFNLTDIFFAVKSKKANFLLKLESSLKKDVSGVSFYDSCKTALDMLEMKGDEFKTLLMEIRRSGFFDYIVVDTDLSIDDKLKNIMVLSNNIVLVNDGSEVSNLKFSRVYEALNILENQSNIMLTPKMVVLYNKFRNNVSKQLENYNLNVLGIIGEYLGVPNKAIALQVAKTEVFNRF